MSDVLALEGTKVIQFGGGAPVPFCTMMLGDLGAEVIKVEAPPRAGARTLGGGRASERAVLYRATGRNKRSIGLNMRSEKARHIFHQLAETADVIAEAWRPGVVKRLGVDYETIAKINPRIVYCSVSGYGQDGPYRELPGHDINYISFGGALDLIGQKDGQPVIPVNYIGDMGGGGMHAVAGILAALIAREKTGKGQYIDLSITDSVISLLVGTASGYFQSGVDTKRGESFISGGSPQYNLYETKDGKYVTLGALEPWLWENFCRAIGREDFIPFTYRNEDRGKWEEISSDLKQIFLTKTRDEWFEELSGKNIEIGKVLSTSEVFTDPQILQREMVVEVEHPTEGKIKQVGMAIKLSDTPGKIRRLSPLLGEHTEEILTGLGYSKQNIDELRQEEVIG